MSDNIKVVVKVRPLISREIEEKLSYQWRVKNNTLYQLDQNGKDLGPSFTFDKVYGEDTKTSDVYNDIAKPIVHAATAGFNGTIFAYGQTSSGKTYTMTGTESSPGIIPLAVLNLFEIIKSIPDRDFLVRVSYIEIYNETVKDLLNVGKDNIKVHETLHGGIKVDASEKVTSSPEEVLEIMKEGEANRQMGATNMNEKSSRSHSIFQITIESREHTDGSSEGGCVNVSQLNLVDLAGSERAGQTGATGIRFKEGTHINKSLSALALVIKQLSEDSNKYANYRDSKLTRILQNSLGGNAKTSIICAVTPAAAEETISTLQFANRAKAIKNKPEVNAVATDATMIQRLTKQMSKLQAQLESKKNLEQDNYNLQKQIAALQRLILNGFAQRRSAEPQGPRRRLPPRRVTIHAAPCAPEPEPPRSLPRFCTPSLKYNPMSMPNPNAPDFVPIKSDNKLASVPEEPPRLVTPPPRRAVNFSDEVIELDSDDESVQGEHETCSPIHKCYGSSKTPPCILRKNAKLAEKNLRDIVELTEREKIYSPSTVELMEKLEENTTVILKLRDEIETLNKHSKEKDLEVDELKNKILKNENELKALFSAKADLQAQCDKYSTKLTDWEVSYETLRNKAKLREEELLSLLDEVKVKKPEDIGKILSRTLEKDIYFMDMSKDISLVNSDHENSIVNPDDINNIVTDTSAQLASTHHNVVELEANLFAHKQKISSLENLTYELEQQISSFKEKLSDMETENSLLKTTVDTLNTTICNQKDSLKSANEDITSYNHVIQELQIKLTQKENLSKVDINDSVLEKMIANEQQVIANNENIVNIIHCFKIALDARNKEIAELQSKCNSAALDSHDILDELQNKTELLNKINLEVDDLKKQINENITLINKLMHEKSNHNLIEEELSLKLADIGHKNIELEKINNDNALCIEQLRTQIDNRTLEIDQNTKGLTEEIEDLTNKVARLEMSITQKDDIISSLNKEKAETEEHMLKAKTAVLKSQTIISTLSGNMQEVPEIIDNFVNIFSALSDSLNTLETAALDIVTEKEEVTKIQNNLKIELEQLQITYNSEVLTLKEQIENLSKAESVYKQETCVLSETINQLNNDLQSLREELDSKTSLNRTLVAKLNEAVEIRSLEMSVSKTEKHQLEQMLLDKDDKITYLTHSLEKIENTLNEKIIIMESFEKELDESRKNKYDILTNILTKITDITVHLNTEAANVTCDLTDDIKIYEQILLSLDKIESHITFINLKNVDSENNEITAILNAAKTEIAELTQKNLSLEEKMFNIEKLNNELLFEIEQNQHNNTKLSTDLKGSQEVLQELQTELKAKASELVSMEDKVKDWKEQFEELDDIMKLQMSELKVENENLKSRIENLRRESELSVVVSDSNGAHCDESQNITTNIKVCDVPTHTDTNSPPSLLTICCNKIVDFIEPKESESKTTTASSNEVENRSEVSNCQCDRLKSELETAKEENSRIIDLLAQMEVVNQHLLHEQDVVRSEIQLLVEPAQELQKKITNHRTNLSILTATTYAENKSLKSQVKVLQHHHKRFHNVCQRDIPDFKKQLSSLMCLLKGEPTSSDQQNMSFKRYSLPDVLDSSTALPNFKNESTLDGDLLMLDTNITLTTAADNTLMGQDQTCLDITQYYTEASCQTNDLNQTTEPNVQQSDVSEQLTRLQEENAKLREIVDKYSNIENNTVDAQNSSPIRNGNHYEETDHKILNISADTTYECANCKDLAVLKESHEKLNNELKRLVEELSNVMTQKTAIEQKYNSLILETPSTDALVKKLNIFEKEYNSQKQEIAKLNHTISSKNRELKSLQEENDTLSNQLMENISEADDLNKDLDHLKQENKLLLEKCHKLEQSAQEYVNTGKTDDLSCSQCVIKDELIQTMQSKATNSHAKLNRSLSDSDTSSRYNKICTLQSELHAGREDCKELTEDVVTIKNHLERSNLSMDLDESMPEANNYSFTKDFEVSSGQSNKCNMPDIPEERTTDIYVMDKMECYNYYVEKTGAPTDSLNCDAKIIDVMKMLYESLISKHGNEVEHLTNRLKEFDEAKNQLQHEYHNVIEKQSQMNKELEEKDKKYVNVTNTFSQIRNNISIIHDKLSNTDVDKTKLLNVFKESLVLLDTEFDLVSVKTFESLIDNIVSTHQCDLSGIMDKYTKLQEHLETVTAELDSVNNNLIQMKTQLSTKENEYNLLKAQKERVHEITNAVTLDIVKREKELKDTIDNGYKTLIELDIVKLEHVDSNLPLNRNINVLFELLITQHNTSQRDKEKEKETLSLELNSLKTLVEDKQKEIDLLKIRNEKSQEVNSGVTLDLNDKDKQLQALTTSYGELNKAYQLKTEAYKANVILTEKLSEEVNQLKTTIADREANIERLEQEVIVQRQQNEELAKLSEVIETAKDLQEENAKLKSLNEMINKEKESYAEELKKSGETIKKNNVDLDKMMSDILVLRESVKDNSCVIEKLSGEAKSLLHQNMELKEQLESKCRECSRLETNIKTHEKTAQIQTRMIMRLEKQKTEEDKILSETRQQLEELSQRYTVLQKQSEMLKTEIEPLRQAKSDLETRVSELEAAAAERVLPRRLSAVTDKLDIGDHGSVEAVFDARPKPDDLFMDVDDNGSNRSTPIRLSKGRDSLSLSRTDQSDKDEEHGSRPSSVLEARRRRQTLHDSRRHDLSHTPSPYGDNESSTISQLRKRLSSCQQELQELKEKYRELDEECETCAEYLKERDAQCARLKKDKLSLQTTITELKEKLQSCNPNMSQMNGTRPTVAHAAVNTDEDWTNLHSLVVDRMSYDAAVDKGRRLARTVDELRCSKQELKNTLAKMQKALDKNASNRELEATRQELQACKQELSQLRDKCRELDEECEICGQYLRDRDEQCRRLKEAKAALEARLEELQASPRPAALRKKRQSAHDLNRAASPAAPAVTAAPTVPAVVHVATYTGDDFLSYQVERDANSRSQADEKHAKEVKHLKLAVERLSQQKGALEAQLGAVTSAPPAMFVATGSAIVQNQQITDVMKENQKLKKMNAKLIHMCKKRGKDSNRENEDPADLR